jgi:hypothetical protein
MKIRRPEGPLPGGIGWQHFALASLPVLVEQAAHRIFRDRYSRSATAWISWTAGLAVTAVVAYSPSFPLWIRCMGLYLVYYGAASSFRKDDLDQLLYLEQSARTVGPFYDEIIKCVSNGLTLQQIERFLRQNNSNIYLIPCTRRHNFDAIPFRLPNSPTEKTFYLGLSSKKPGGNYFYTLNDTGFICDPHSNAPLDSLSDLDQRQRELLDFLKDRRNQPLHWSRSIF